MASNEAAIGKLVEEIFHEADDDGDGVLSLREVLSHSKFITKKILMRNTSWMVRTNRIRRKLQPEGSFEF